MLSRLDDYLAHQIAEPIRYVATEDRNFYDRYYFNVHSCSDDFFLVLGLGQYPNLSTQDGYVAARIGDRQYVMRTSRILGDRLDATCGPLRIEVIDGLERLRVTIGPNPSGIEADLLFEAAHAARLEPRQFHRHNSRVQMDIQRFGQNGRYSGWIRTQDREFHADASWRGYRDRSWGIRPVGEAEPAGIDAYNPAGAAGQARNWRWFYTAAMFDEFSLMIKLHEDNDGRRYLEEAVRIWHDGRPPEHLNRIDADCRIDSKTKLMETATIYCPDAPGGAMTIAVTQMLPIYLEAETGYGRGKDRSWTHGQYRGELVTDALEFDLNSSDPRLHGSIDAVARFEFDGHVGYGLLEYIFFGRFDRFSISSSQYWNQK